MIYDSLTMWNEPNQVINLIEKHLTRRPGMQLRDIYKLLYQGVRGPEHLITSPESFRQYLAEEWGGLEPAEEEPLTESIHPDGSLLRLNLRPYKAMGGDLERLVAACLETARRAWGTPDDLIEAWEHFYKSCQDGTWPSLDLQEVDTLNSLLLDNQFPPIHHSERYRKLYRPAYRLIAAQIELHTPL